MDTASPTTAAIPSSSRPSRQAAQKAAAAIAIASQKPKLPKHIMDAEDLLKEALRPMKDEDKEDHKAWVEMESDPAYFSDVLKGLGVADVKVQELFAITNDQVEQLPQPVYGFVLCCRYEGEDQEDTQKAPQDLWFANQTMANGCGTVALINIVMNQPTITLGPLLTAFKAATAPADPLVRGYRLDSHPEIRHAHNAFARRFEHLNADLLLENEFDNHEGDADAAFAKFNKKKRKATAKTRRPAKKRKNSSTTCHYKAFLFALDQVWVLDGLEENPVSLGAATEATWLDLAITGVKTKLADAGPLVSVLAVCQAPTRRLRAELLTNIAALAAARRALPASARPARQPQTLYYEPDLAATPADAAADARALASFGLTPGAVLAAAAEEEPPAPAVVVVHALEAAQTQLVVAYNEQEMGAEGEAARCEQRKEDFGAAIHAWVARLAARGALQALAEVEDGPAG